MAHPSANMLHESDRIDRERGAWAPGQSYAIGDHVTQGGDDYIAVIGQHYSKVFATELAAGLWQLFSATLLHGGGGGGAPAQVHRGPFSTWASLPAAGGFVGEFVRIADMTGAPDGSTGAGAAEWDGAAWQPQGGSAPASVTSTPAATIGDMNLLAPLPVSSQVRVTNDGNGQPRLFISDGAAFQPLSTEVFNRPTIATRDALVNLYPGDYCEVADDGTGQPATYQWDGNSWNLESVAAASDTITDHLTIATLNTLPTLTATPATGTAVRLHVQGAEFFSDAPVPVFSVAGTAITWDAVAATFDIYPGDRVVAEYEV
ncbi:MAG: hypothetical protein ACR2RL_21720 [Gammaproteobacteria bacterium]